MIFNNDFNIIFDIDFLSKHNRDGSRRLIKMFYISN